MEDGDALRIEFNSNLKEYGIGKMEQAIDELLDIVAALSSPFNLERKINGPEPGSLQIAKELPLPPQVQSNSAEA